MGWLRWWFRIRLQVSMPVPQPRRWPFIRHENPNLQMRSPFTIFMADFISESYSTFELNELEYSFCAIFMFRRTNEMCASRTRRTIPDYESDAKHIFEIEINPVFSVNACKCQVQSGNGSRDDFIRDNDDGVEHSSAHRRRITKTQNNHRQIHLLFRKIYCLPNRCSTAWSPKPEGYINYYYCDCYAHLIFVFCFCFGFDSCVCAPNVKSKTEKRPEHIGGNLVITVERNMRIQFERS